MQNIILSGGDILELLEIAARCLAAVFAGLLIGSERARHGQAAGMRTHILVCLGSCMTALTSVFAASAMGLTGDVFRIPAQVVSGIGFLGAGMIILKSNNMIVGLTTAAGVWTTATIGIALGFGFYSGAAIVTVLFLVTVVLLSKFEKRKKSYITIYLEADASAVNAVLKYLKDTFGAEQTFTLSEPRSGRNATVGLNICFEQSANVDVDEICKLDNVVFAVEE